MIILKAHLMIKEAIIKYSHKPPPEGFPRFLYRLPLWIYRLGLGGFLGKRFIRIFHKGRISGKKREAVVEIVRFEPESGTAVTISAWGDRADWFRNIRKNPQVEAQIGWNRFAAEATILSEDQRVTEFLNYARIHPVMAVRLPGLVGYELDGSEDDFIAFAKVIEMVAVRPA
jgi:deazaflavin-dependent oxidoreductase (nitroreductase family)